MRGTCPMCSVLQILGYDDYHRSLGIHSIQISLEDFSSLFDYYFLNVSKYTFIFACRVYSSAGYDDLPQWGLVLPGS